MNFTFRGKKYRLKVKSILFYLFWLILLFCLGRQIVLYCNRPRAEDNPPPSDTTSSGILSSESSPELSLDSPDASTPSSSDVTHSEDLSSTPSYAASDSTSTSSEESPSVSSEPTPSSSNGQTATQNPGSGNLILINASHPIPDDFPVRIVPFSHDISVSKEIEVPLRQMIDDAAKEGLSIIPCSGYRDFAYQQQLFNKQVQSLLNLGYSDQEAYNEAKTVVAVPRTSEHHSGLAVDLVALNYQILDEGLLDTEEVQWLYRHCHEYGFIVRYPENKSHLTGIIYEPWHYRYVGVEAATYIQTHDICLEEYLALDLN